MSRNEVEFVVDPQAPVITTRRVVNAPRALTWDCFTKVEHLRRWKAPKGVDLLVMECDVRPGGAWRVLYKGPHGEFGFHGEYREVAANERYVRTFIRNGTTDEIVETVVLTDAGPGKTLITAQNVYPSMAVREALVQQGGHLGAQKGYEALDDLLESLGAGGGASHATT